MLRELNSIEEVVAELGGNDAVMELAGLESVSAVPVWKHRGKFPGYTYPIIQGALKAKGATAPDGLWKLKRSPRKDAANA